jgi:hypothetical protein
MARHNVHFIAYGMIIMFALFLGAQHGCFAQHRPVPVQRTR